MLIKDNVLSPIIMVQWNIAGYFLLKVASSIADIPNFSLSPWEEEIPVALKLVRKKLDLEPIIMRI